MRRHDVLRLALAGTLAMSGAVPGFAQDAGISRPAVVSDSTRRLRLTPTLAGFRIGEKMADARARLGTATRVDTLRRQSDPVLSVADQSTGITIIGNRASGVAIVLLSSRDAGNLDSIRVGDERAKVLGRWGPPAASSESSALWLAGRYMVGVEFDDVDRVTRLILGFAR